MSPLNKRFRNQDGFSLLEVILSIGALAVLSIFILQMFIVSANANKRAQEMDVASAMAISELDRLSLADNYAEFYRGLQNIPSRASVTDESILSLSSDPKAAYNKLIVVYNEGWEDITEFFTTQLSEAGDIDLSETDARYVMLIDGQPNGAEDLAGELFDITVTVYSVNNMTTVYSSDKNTTRTLVEYSTSKYFPDSDFFIYNTEADDNAVAEILVRIELEKIAAADRYWDYVNDSNALIPYLMAASSTNAPDGTLLIPYDKDWQKTVVILGGRSYDPENGDLFTDSSACYALYIDLQGDGNADENGCNKKVTITVENVESGEVLTAASTDKYFSY